MRNIILIILGVVITFIRVNAQSTHSISSISFQDKMTRNPIADVLLLSPQGVVIAQSDSTGIARIPPNYTDTSGLYTYSYNYQQDTIYPGEYTIYLKPLTALLKEVTISPVKIVLPSPTEYIVDYNFVGNNILIASYSGNNGKNAKLFLLNSNDDTLAMKKLDIEPLAIFKSCTGACYYTDKKQLHSIETGKREIKETEVLDKRILPLLAQCQCVTNDRFYYRKINYGIFRVNFTYCHKGNSKEIPFYTYENKNAVKANRSDMRMIQQLSAMGDINGIRRILSTGVLCNQELRAYLDMPLFTHGDTLALFDFPKKIIRLYHLDGKPIEIVTMKFNWDLLQSVAIIQDEITKKIYLHSGVHKAVQTIQQVNIGTGMLINARMILDRNFVEDVKVHNSTIYYLWQDEIRHSVRQMYQQDINL